MSGDPIIVVIPSGIARRSQQQLNALNERFFSRLNRQVLQTDLGRAARWPAHSVLRLFLKLEDLGAAKVEVRAYHRDSGVEVAHYPFSDGPPDLPIEIDVENYTNKIESLDDLEFEISAVLTKQVILSETSA